MVLDFQQGIVTYPVDDGQQSFLNYSNGYYSLTATNGKTDVTFAHGTENYLHTESQTVPNAWGPLPPGTDCWLFWDINPQTGIRTFGFTTVQPVFSATQPTYAEDQHWFNTSDNRMRVGYQGRFIERIRVFAAKVNSAVITPLGSRYLTHPFAGSQVDLYTANTIAGRIVTDSTGRPVRKANKTFFTTEDEIFVSGSPVNVIKLEASVVTATALEPLPKFHVVKYTDFGKVELASYNDTGTSTIAMVMEDLENGETGSICIQGVVTNPDWNWPFVGRELWITTAGVLTPVDPHIESPLTYVTSRVPVARVISPTSVIFDQGLGGKGDSTAGGGSATVGMATTDDAGILKISTPPSDPQNPIAVGTNDVRVTTALLKTGGAMTGDLVLANNPTANNHAANKQYVDSLVSDSKLKVSQGGVLIQPDVTKMNFVGATVTASASGEVRVEVDEGNWIVEEFTVPGTPGSPATPDVTGDQLTVAHDVQSRVDRVYIPKQTVIDSDPIPEVEYAGWVSVETTVVDNDSDLLYASQVALGPSVVHTIGSVHSVDGQTDLRYESVYSSVKPLVGGDAGEVSSYSIQNNYTDTYGTSVVALSDSEVITMSSNEDSYVVSRRTINSTTGEYAEVWSNEFLDTASHVTQNVGNQTIAYNGTDSVFYSIPTSLEDEFIDPLYNPLQHAVVLDPGFLTVSTPGDEAVYPDSIAYHFTKQPFGVPFASIAELGSTALNLTPGTYEVILEIDGITRSVTGTESDFSTIQNMVDYLNTSMSAYATVSLSLTRPSGSWGYGDFYGFMKFTPISAFSNAYLPFPDTNPHTRSVGVEVGKINTTTGGVEWKHSIRTSIPVPDPGQSTESVVKTMVYDAASDGCIFSFVSSVGSNDEYHTTIISATSDGVKAWERTFADPAEDKELLGMCLAGTSLCSIWWDWNSSRYILISMSSSTGIITNIREFNVFASDDDPSASITQDGDGLYLTLLINAEVGTVLCKLSLALVPLWQVQLNYSVPDSYKLITHGVGNISVNSTHLAVCFSVDSGSVQG